MNREGRSVQCGDITFYEKASRKIQELIVGADDEHWRDSKAQA